MASNDDWGADDQRAWQLIRDGREAEAEPILRDLVAKQPGEWGPAHDLAVLLVRLGPQHYDEARQLAETALDLVQRLTGDVDEKLTYAYSACGDIAWRQKRYNDAADHYREAVKCAQRLAQRDPQEVQPDGTPPNSGQYWMSWARYYAWFVAGALQRLGKHAEALEALDIALDYDWRGIKPVTAIKEALLGHGDWGAASVIVAFWRSSPWRRVAGLFFVLLLMVALIAMTIASFWVRIYWPPLAPVALLSLGVLCLPVLRKVWVAGTGLEISPQPPQFYGEGKGG